MGGVLAVNRASFAILGALALFLSACGQGGGGQRLAAVAMGTVAGMKPSAVTAQAPLDARKLDLTMLSAGLKFPVVPVEQDGDVTVWAAQDGSQVALRGGVLIWSRGFGMDLMSAEAPSLGQLSSGGTTRRVYHFIDGTNKPIRIAFDCTVTSGDSISVAKHLLETCQSDQGKITNEFWINGQGGVAKSRQWLSPGVGHLVFEGNGG
jgi:hypothetical protein